MADINKTKVAFFTTSELAGAQSSFYEHFVRNWNSQPKLPVLCQDYERLIYFSTKTGIPLINIEHIRHVKQVMSRRLKGETLVVIASFINIKATHEVIDTWKMAGGSLEMVGGEEFKRGSWRSYTGSEIDAMIMCQCEELAKEEPTLQERKYKIQLGHQNMGELNRYIENTSVSKLNPWTMINSYCGMEVEIMPYPVVKVVRI